MSQIELGKILTQREVFDFVLQDGDLKFDGLMTDIFFINKLLSKKGMYVQRNLWNPSVRTALSFLLSNYHYRITNVNLFESLLLNSLSMRKKYLQKLGYLKLDDLLFLQKEKDDHRNWDHFKFFLIQISS